MTKKKEIKKVWSIRGIAFIPAYVTIDVSAADFAKAEKKAKQMFNDVTQRKKFCISDADDHGAAFGFEIVYPTTLLK